nr:MAG TPA: hypothetical protein [Caudoviricetes sp.]
MHSIGVNQCTSSFALCVNSSGNITGVLCIFITNCINVAVRSAKMLS